MPFEGVIYLYFGSLWGCRFGKSDKFWNKRPPNEAIVGRRKLEEVQISHRFRGRQQLDPHQIFKIES